VGGAQCKNGKTDRDLTYRSGGKNWEALPFELHKLKMEKLTGPSKVTIVGYMSKNSIKGREKREGRCLTSKYRNQMQKSKHHYGQIYKKKDKKIHHYVKGQWNGGRMKPIKGEGLTPRRKAEKGLSSKRKNVIQQESKTVRQNVTK